MEILRQIRGAVLLPLLLIAGCGRQAPAPLAQPVRLGLAHQAPSALAILAVEEGCFAAEGLTVQPTDYVSGVRAVDGLLKGEVDVATSAEVPAVAASFARRDFRVFTTIAASENENRLVARKDRGITQVADLRGKRVATQRASAVHFFLHLLLLENGLTEKEVTIEYLPAEQLAGAVADGRVDAITMREPIVSDAIRLLGTNATVISGFGLYHRTEIVLGSAQFLEANREAAARLIRGLRRAEALTRARPDYAATVIARRLGMSPVQIQNLWHGTQLRVALDQSLLSSFEDEARWMISAKLVPSNALPNYLQFLELGPMMQVCPAAMTIIH